MAATIMWLRGYHAGKTAVIPSHSNVPYGGRLRPTMQVGSDKAALVELLKQTIAADRFRGVAAFRSFALSRGRFRRSRSPRFRA